MSLCFFFRFIYTGFIRTTLEDANREEEILGRDDKPGFDL